MSIIHEFLGESYFFLMGLETNHITSYREEDGFAYGKRASGVLHVTISNEVDIASLIKLLREEDYTKLYMSKLQWERLCKKVPAMDEGAYIARRLPSNEYINVPVASLLTSDRLNDVEALYKDVFVRGFAKEAYMRDKLESKRGRGYYYSENGMIQSVVQTDFETDKAAIIVGVASDVKYRGRGLATDLLKVLLADLDKEKKNSYLLYDNLDAGKIYERLGFEVYDQMITIKKENLLRVLS